MFWPHAYSNQIRNSESQNKKMSFLTWHTSLLLSAFILICFLTFTKPNEETTQEIHKPWYENLPAVAMDYKVHIDAGKEDCYYQYVQAGATFYVSFSVSSVVHMFRKKLNIFTFTTIQLVCLQICDI